MKPLVSCIITIFEDFRDEKATKMKVYCGNVLTFNSFAVELVLSLFLCVCKVVDVIFSTDRLFRLWNSLIITHSDNGADDRCRP